MSKKVTRLIEALNAPESATSKTWTPTETELGTSLPSDYKELIDRIGGGHIEEYMYILEPDCPNENYSLVHHARERTEAYDALFEVEEKPPELQVEGSQILPWAMVNSCSGAFYRDSTPMRGRSFLTKPGVRHGNTMR